MTVNAQFILKCDFWTTGLMYLVAIGAQVTE